MTTMIALFLLGGLLGFGGAFVVKAVRDGRRGTALVMAALLLAVAAFLAWQAMMVLDVGPAMR